MSAKKRRSLAYRAARAEKKKAQKHRKILRNLIDPPVQKTFIIDLQTDGLKLSGGNSSGGSNILLYGRSHVTNPKCSVRLTSCK